MSSIHIQSSPGETSLSPPPLRINTGGEFPSSKHEEPLESEAEHEPNTPTSSTSSSTSSFTTVTADLFSSAVEMVAHTSQASNNSNPSSPSTARILSSALDETTPPTPPKTTRRKSKSPESSSFQGLDDKTPTNGNVIDYHTEQPVSRRIIYTEKLITQSLRVAYEGRWSFCKVFGDGTFLASGYVHLLPGGRKNAKSVRDNTYIFHVIEGAVNVKIHDTAYIIAQGGSFMVPRGNCYSIENICEQTAKLVFVQSREVTAGEQDDPLRLVRGQPPPQLLPALTKSKLFILVGWVLERLLKRFMKYRKVVLAWYLRTAMQVGRYVKGPKTYVAFFVLGFLFRSLGPSRSLLPRINVQVIRD